MDTEITKEQHDALLANHRLHDGNEKPVVPKIEATRVRKIALLPDGRYFDLHGLQIVYAVEGKVGEEWRALKRGPQLCIFKSPKLAAAFMHGRKITK